MPNFFDYSFVFVSVVSLAGGVFASPQILQPCDAVLDVQCLEIGIESQDRNSMCVEPDESCEQVGTGRPVQA